MIQEFYGLAYCYALHWSNHFFKSVSPIVRFNFEIYKVISKGKDSYNWYGKTRTEESLDNNVVHCNECLWMWVWPGPLTDQWFLHFQSYLSFDFSSFFFFLKCKTRCWCGENMVIFQSHVKKRYKTRELAERIEFQN